MDPFWEAFWNQFGAKLANYTHFGPLWHDFRPLWAVKFKMQIRLGQKCSSGGGATGRVGGMGLATPALADWTLDSSGRDFTRQTSAKLMRRIQWAPPSAAGPPP